MSLVHRVLYPSPITSLDEYLARGGGIGIEAARAMTPAAIIERVLASGLRGTGEQASPPAASGRRWPPTTRPTQPSTVIVNAAEGEPGTFKDRTILRRNPYVVLEGALIAARAVGADLVVVAMKEAFEGEIDRVREAIEDVECAGWNDGVELVVFEGPDEYLYGEEQRAAGDHRRPVAVPADRPDVPPGPAAGAAPRRRPERAGAGQQHRDAGQRRPHRRPRSRLVPHHGHRRVAGHDRLHRHRRAPSATASARCRWARRSARSSS